MSEAAMEKRMFDMYSRRVQAGGVLVGGDGGVLVGGKKKVMKKGYKSKGGVKHTKSAKTKAKVNPWIKHVKKYAKAHGCTYGEALKLSRKSYRPVG